MTRRVVALGGNLLGGDSIDWGDGSGENGTDAGTGEANADENGTDDDATAHERTLATVRDAVERIAPLYDEGEVVLTHGNGPQVGARLREDEATPTGDRPLDVHVAETQGGIGTLFVRALAAALDRPPVAATTHVVVDPDDPAFDDPTKRIGPTYDPETAAGKPFDTAPVPGDEGRRRVVASPRPQSVVERPHLAALVARDAPLVCGGGGGVPVVETAEGYDGVAAVVDKDYTAQLVATAVDADELVVVTDVAYAYLDYGSSSPRPIGATDPGTLREYVAADEFDAGSMRPKVAACAQFVEAGGDRAVITRPADLDAALAGEAGTRVRPAAETED